MVSVSDPQTSKPNLRPSLHPVHFLVLWWQQIHFLIGRLYTALTRELLHLDQCRWNADLFRNLTYLYLVYLQLTVSLVVQTFGQWCDNLLPLCLFDIGCWKLDNPRNILWSFLSHQNNAKIDGLLARRFLNGDLLIEDKFGLFRRLDLFWDCVTRVLQLHLTRKLHFHLDW